LLRISRIGSVSSEARQCLLKTDALFRNPGANQKANQPAMRLMTDFTGARYWTLVAEMEVESLAAFEKSMQGADMTEEMQKEFGRIMEGYHDLVESGHREIFKIEG